MRTALLSLLVAIFGCVVQPASESPPTTPAPGGGGGSGAATPIEAPCSFNGTMLQGDIGSEFQVSCPANCQAEGHNVWGSDAYTLDSNVCKAGIHAGAIGPAGGIVAVRIDAGRPAFRGSARNGIQSGDFGAYPKTFVVTNAGSSVAAAAGAAAQVIEAGCSYNAGQIVGDVGSRHLVSCPANCIGQGWTWGTDLYTDTSAVCRTAIHAGLLTDAGGTVAVILAPGQPSYKGSDRNGVKSMDDGGRPKSYRLEKP